MKKTEKTIPPAIYRTMLHYAWPIIWVTVKVNPRSWFLFEFAIFAEYCWPWLPFYWTYFATWIEKSRQRH